MKNDGFFVFSRPRALAVRADVFPVDRLPAAAYARPV